MHAQIGAYSEQGYEWVEELKQVLEGNCRYACGFINEKLDGVSVTMPEGTYMIFLDCTEYCQRTGKNLAVPFSRTQEACDRLEKYVFVK